ncbi:MAG TPA: AAC(3) family N-acetyltransferase [Paludibacter sp.]|nr:AAC(3) family N-acetyltransferase [Paludibacter sp.]
MILTKLLYKILPKKVFLDIRYSFYIYKKKFHKPIPEDKFKQFLSQKLGIQKGSVVFIHSSMDFLNFESSPEEVLDLLLDSVGTEGTLIFPAWHFNYRAEVYLQKNKIFDLKRSPAVLGLLPETARRHPLALRSIHPTSSIVAIGKYAAEITGEHHKSIYPCGELSPYYKMMKYNAIIVGLGVTSHFLSFMHCPEDVLKEKFPIKTRTDEVFSGKVKLADGSIVEVKTLAAHINIVHRDFPAYSKKYLSKEIFSEYKLAGSNFFRADSVKLFNRVIELAEKGVTIYTL